MLAQQDVAALAATAIDFPSMQAPASYNLDAVKKEIEEKSGATKASSRLDLSARAIFRERPF